jgi:hypothetical protein
VVKSRLCDFIKFLRAPIKSPLQTFALSLSSLAGKESCLYDQRGDGHKESTYYNTSRKTAHLRAMTVCIAAAM